MKELSLYINETITPLNDYVVNEGLVDWLKKFWNWITDSNKENVKKNDGKYIIPDDDADVLKGKKPKTKFTVKSVLCNKDKNDKNSFKSIINSLSDGDKSSFKKAKDAFYKDKPEYVTFTTVTIGKNPYSVAFMFYGKPESNNSIKQTNFYSSEQFDNGNEFDTEVIKEIYNKSNSLIEKQTKCEVYRDR